MRLLYLQRIPISKTGATRSGRNFRPTLQAGAEARNQTLQRVLVVASTTTQPAWVVQREYKKLEPPGDCSPEKYGPLKRDVDSRCKTQARTCKGNDDCATLLEKIQRNADCIAARVRMNTTCFRGGDPKHQDVLKREIAVLMHCWTVYTKKKCAPDPRPEPQRVPDPLPVLDKLRDSEYVRKLAEATGLGLTAALILYIVVSEGSRLFPPRNLIPVP